MASLSPGRWHSEVTSVTSWLGQTAWWGVEDWIGTVMGKRGKPRGLWGLNPTPAAAETALGVPHGSQVQGSW